MYNQCTQESFLKNVANHNLTVVRDEGTEGRHLKFSNNGSFEHAFEILTWPGKLIISGDCGTYVFSRIHDMFDFFRSDESGINPDYWHEKVLSGDERSGVEEYSSELFEDAVKDCFERHFEGVDDGKRQQAWSAIEEEVLRDYSSEELAIDAALGFSYENFSLEDFWDYKLKRYTARYIWCCRAVVWAIDQYDLTKQKQAS